MLLNSVLDQHRAQRDDSTDHRTDDADDCFGRESLPCEIDWESSWRWRWRWRWKCGGGKKRGGDIHLEMKPWRQGYELCRLLGVSA
jgi:hypothetical protein